MVRYMPADLISKSESGLSVRIFSFHMDLHLSYCADAPSFESKRIKFKNYNNIGIKLILPPLILKYKLEKRKMIKMKRVY